VVLILKTGVEYNANSHIQLRANILLLEIESAGVWSVMYCMDNERKQQ